jgi:tryptophan synthase beta subunit
MTKTEEERKKYNEYHRQYRQKNKEKLLQYWHTRYEKIKDDEEFIEKRKEYNKNYKLKLKKTQEEVNDKIFAPEMPKHISS